MEPSPSSYPIEDNPQVLFAWKAPLRAYKKRGMNVLRFYISLAILLSLIVFFFGDRILLIPIWAVLFLFYTLTITPPPEVENKLTKFGVETAGITMRWETLSHFYFFKRFGFTILVIVGHAYFTSYMVIPNEEIKTRVKQLLSEHILYQDKPAKNLTDVLIDWLSRLMPDDEEVVKQPFHPVSFSQKPQHSSL
ncbi:hypothetical protein HGB07_03855 [Candidatus Roizmanbacteria bacterium]|nr:hypothetical protein [Candidatus Roizmanbacteria bacterium]